MELQQKTPLIQNDTLSFLRQQAGAKCIGFFAVQKERQAQHES